MKMQKKELFLKGILVLLIAGVALFAFCYKKNDITTDAKKFKSEYESLNDTDRSNGGKYNSVSIPEENPMKYVTVKEATDIIKNKSGMIYIGANWCPWCRNAVEILIDVAKERNVNTVYYLDLTEYRNVWEVKEGKLEKTTVEKEGYYELLEALDSVLGKNTYTVKDKDGKTYDTKEKRIYMPTVIAIKNGKIEDTHVGTVDLNKDQTAYDKLNEEQVSKLKEKYISMFAAIDSSICSSGDYCE